MTTSQETETQTAEATETATQKDPSYVIDLSRLEELHRSLGPILLSRRCPSCRDQIQESGEIPSDAKQIRDIARCCAKKEGFIRPELPLQEIVFRTLLAAGKKTTTLSQLHYEVTERWYTPANPRNITVAGLGKVLDSDVYYGFKKVETAGR